MPDRRDSAALGPLFAGAAAGGVLAMLLLAGCGSGEPRQGLSAEAGSLMEELRAVSPDARLRAAVQLGQRREVAAVPLLVDCLQDVRLDIRKAAATALGMIGARAATAGLGAVVQTADADPELRRLAADALGEIADPASIPILTQALGSGDMSLAHASAYALARVGPPALDTLLTALREGSTSVQRAAAGVMGQFPGERTATALRPLLTHSNAAVRLSAAESLTRAGCTNLAAEIVARLEDPDDNVRRGVLALLDDLGPAAAEPLAALLSRPLRRSGSPKKGEPNETAGLDPNLRQVIAAQLMKSDTAAAIRPLLLVKDVTVRIKRQTESPVQRVLQLAARPEGRAELLRLAVDDPLVGFSALGVLSELLRVAQADRETAAERQAAVRGGALSWVAPRLDDLARGLTSGDDAVRLETARCLCLLGDPRGKEPVLAALREALAQVREAAASAERTEKQAAAAKLAAARAKGLLRALQPFADRSLSMELLPLFQADVPKGGHADLEEIAYGAEPILVRFPDPAFLDPMIRVIKQAHALGQLAGLGMRVLGAIGDRRAFEPIAQYLRALPNDNYCANARLVAYRALLQCDRERAATVTGEFLTALKPHSIAQMEGLARLYAEFPAAGAVLPLTYWIDHDIASVQMAVRSALEALGEKDVSWLVAGFEVESSAKRSALAGVIGGFGARALPVALKAAKDPRPRIRQGAVWTLGCLDGDEAAQAVRIALGDDQPGVRAAAAWSAGNMKRRDLAPAVAALLKDSDLAPRAMAARQLGRMGDRAAVPPLIEALGNEDPEVRGFAAASLGDLGATSALAALTDALNREKVPDARAGMEYAMKKLGAPPAAKRPELAETNP
jgi:HEAT repeat protein